MGCREYKESSEDVENYKMWSFIEYYYDDNTRRVTRMGDMSSGLPTCKTAYS
jgi:hypothetical protein